MTRYLGDGVYADIEDGMLMVTTQNGVYTTNRIFFERAVWEGLKEYAEEVWK